MSTSSGIQTLLEAEKEAAKIVAKAKAYRLQRLKDAKMEAEREIAALKAAKTSEFSALESGTGADEEGGGVKARVDRETEEKLTEMKRVVGESRGLVLEKLLVAVGNVVPKVHPNVQRTSAKSA